MDVEEDIGTALFGGASGLGRLTVAFFSLVVYGMVCVGDGRANDYRLLFYEISKNKNNANMHALLLAKVTSMSCGGVPSTSPIPINVQGR